MSICIKNDIQELQSVLSAFRMWLSDNGLHLEQLPLLELCLEEVLTNCISYGWDIQPSQDSWIQVHFSIDQSAQRVSVEISDTGRPFNPLKQVPLPSVEASLDARTPGGLGVYFVRTSMDDVTYKRDQGRNVLTLFKNIRYVSEEASFPKVSSRSDKTFSQLPARIEKPSRR